MNYVSFDEQITAKHGIVREPWPFPHFKSPSSMSHLEAEMTLRALESGTAGFRSLSDAEWQAWLSARYTPLAITAPNDPSASDATPPPGEAPGETENTPARAAGEDLDARAMEGAPEDVNTARAENASALATEVDGTIMLP